MRATVRSKAVVGVTSITWPHVEHEQVMVVVQEVLGHLETGELVTRGDAPHDARRAGGPRGGGRPNSAGRRATRCFDVRDTQRAFRGGQELDDRATPDGVALVDPA